MFNTFASGLRNSIAKISPVKLLASTAICYFILNKGKLLVSNKKMLCRDKSVLNQDNQTEYFETIDIQEMMKTYPNLTIMNTKSVEMLIGLIRDKNLEVKDFRFYSKRLLRLIIEEALAVDCNVEIVRESPLGLYKTITSTHKMSDYVAVSILRSGNSMVDEIVNIVPEIRIGKILLQRDEESVEKNPIFYFDKLPSDLKGKRIFLLDPMAASGGSAALSIEILLKKGVKEEDIFFLCLISCEVAVKKLFSKFPKMKIITAKMDPVLLPNKYIAPGLGDFGDRFYGTKM